MQNEKMMQLVSMSMDELEESIKSIKEDLSFRQQVFDMRKRSGERTTKQLKRKQKLADAKQKQEGKRQPVETGGRSFSGFASESPAGHGDSTK